MREVRGGSVKGNPNARGDTFVMDQYMPTWAWVVVGLIVLGAVFGVYMWIG